MKGLIRSAALIIMLALLLTLAACGGSDNASADSMAGAYRMVDAAGDGAKELLRIKDGFLLRVNDDNTGVLSLMTDKRELRFDPASMTCTPDKGEKVSYTYDGKLLTLSKGKVRMIFEKQ